MAKRKIDAMHAEYGYGGGRCEDCIHCVRLEPRPGKRYYKCALYGVSAAESTDWRLSYLACGMINHPLPKLFTPMIDVLKREMKRGSAEPIEGQMMLCGAKMDEVDGYE